MERDGRWWRFNRYEVVERGEGSGVEHLIVPASGARFEEYDVEALYAGGGGRTLYLSLADVGRSLVPWWERKPLPPRNDDETRAWRAEGATEMATPVLDWCSRYGLLGGPDFVVEGEHRTGSWEAFWRGYGETFSTFAVLAIIICGIVRDIGSQRHSDRVRAVDDLNRFLPTLLTPLLVKDGEEWRVEWVTPSLFGDILSMVTRDLAGGVRFGTCERCGRAFSSRRSEKRYCSMSCQEAAKKARKRDNDAFRSAELQRRRALRDLRRTEDPGPSRKSGQS
jgi:hypothetical protein